MGYENPNASVLVSGSARNHYGPKLIGESEQFGGQVSTSGFNKQAVWEFDWDNLPVNGPGSMEALIPAGATIMSCDVEVVTAMAGTVGTLTVGLEEADGTLIDIDGLGTAAEMVQAALVDNAVIPGTGALIDSQIDVDGQLLVVAGGTVTGGRFRVIVEYRQGDFDATGTYTAGGVKGNG